MVPPEYSNGEDERTKKSDEIDDLLTGNPDYRQGQVAEDEEGKDEDKPVANNNNNKDDGANEEVDENAKQQARLNEPLLELERLAVVLKSIVHDCLIVPKGLYKLTPNHELRFNDQ